MLEWLGRKAECLNHGNIVDSKLTEIGDGKRYGKSQAVRVIN
jgi:hypothetical protein